MTLFQRALRREPVPCPPVWMMRQAGRYHRHYQALRAKHSFIDLCKIPTLAAEVAMGPIRDFDFDVAILFSDLLFPLEALGMGLRYEPGPKLDWHLKNIDDLKKLRDPAKVLPELHFQAEAMQKTRTLLPATKSLIGFVGGPWTLFAYASRGSHVAAMNAKSDYVLFQKFSEMIVPLLKQNVELQLEAGAEVVMIFDTAAGQLAEKEFQDYVTSSLKHLAQKNVGYYLKEASQAHYDLMWKAELPFAGYGFDHVYEMKKILRTNPVGFSQGNFDQDHLSLPPTQFEQKFHTWLGPLTKLTPAERFGWVAGLGHGITPQAREENVRAFVQLLREAFKNT